MQEGEVNNKRSTVCASTSGIRSGARRVGQNALPRSSTKPLFGYLVKFLEARGLLHYVTIIVLLNYELFCL